METRILFLFISTDILILSYLLNKNLYKDKLRNYKFSYNTTKYYIIEIDYFNFKNI